MHLAFCSSQMFVMLTHEVIRTAPWGLMWRVSLGAALSAVEIVTDVNVTLGFRNNKEQAVYYYAMLVSLGLSVGLQLFVAILQVRDMRAELRGVKARRYS